MVEEYFCIFYFLDDRGIWESNVLFENTCHMHKSTILRIFKSLFSLITNILVFVVEEGVTRNEGSPNSLALAFLKVENRSLQDLERIIQGEVAAVHTNPRHLHPSEPCVGLQKVPDVIVGVAHKGIGPP